MNYVGKDGLAVGGGAHGRGGLGLAMRLGWREMRGGLSGFGVFIACLALGVMVITAVGALSDALRAGVERQGEQLLGGDVTFTRSHARASDGERAWLGKRGRVSETATMRSMARRADGSEQALIELKAVDGTYPLAGQVRLAGGGGLEKIAGATGGAVVEPILLERLGVKVGDTIEIGQARLVIKDVIEAEPDGLGDRLSYGSRVLISTSSLMSTQLVQPGSLVRWRYALKLAEGTGVSASDLKAVREAMRLENPESGFTAADRRDPNPQVTRSLERLRQFLTLVGLTALLVGGVGVANSVGTFLAKKRSVVAIYKSLGASSALVMAVYLVQVLAMAVVGVVIGLAAGLAVPAGLVAVYGAALPVPAEIAVSGATLLLAVVYGMAVAVLFALWPLGRAAQVSPTVLFRDDEAGRRIAPGRGVMLALLVLGLGILALVLVTSDSKLVALYFCLAVAGVLAIFIGLGVGIERLARRLPRPAVAELALAVGNIGAAGGITRSVVLSLGLGLSLLVAVSLADAALLAQLNERLPGQSPNYFVLDVGKGDLAGLGDVVRKEDGNAQVSAAPMLRGRLVRLKGRLPEDMKVVPEAQWVLSGDRGLTYADEPPLGSRVVAGSWWAKDYAGEPLVSFEADLARKLGLGLGDEVTVNVLGRNVTARIANLREVNWESLAINFVMVFSPNTLKAAPHNLLATVTLDKNATLEAESRVARAIGRAYPAVTAIRVKDAINAFAAVYGKVMLAVRVAGSVTLLAGALVLAGALATAQRRRVLEAVILKTLGATRRRILFAHLAEYASLALLTAGAAVVLGSLTAWLALTQVLDVAFVFSGAAVLRALVLALVLVLGFGAAGTWRVLSARPVPILRSE